MMFQTQTLEFLKDLKGIPSLVSAYEIANAASEGEIAQFETIIGSRLPPVFRNFLKHISAGINVQWFLGDGVFIQLSNEREPIYAGGLSFQLDRLLMENPQFQEGYESCKYDDDYRPPGLLALTSTGNGDQFALVLDGPDGDSIKYLSHDLDDIHLYKVGSDIDSFLQNYARIGFVGPEYWIWEQFTDQRTTPINGKGSKALEFLNLLRSGSASSSAFLANRPVVAAPKFRLPDRPDPSKSG